MKLIDIIEKTSDFVEIKLDVEGEYVGTFKNRGEITYNYLRLEVLYILVVCDDKQGFLCIDLER